MEMNLVLPLPTSINSLYVNQSIYNPKSKKFEITGRRILSKEGRKTKSRIMGEARAQMLNQEWDYEATKDIYLYQDAVIYFPRRGMDDNNVYKLLNDSLEKIIYDNDSRVLVRTQKILYDTKNPRVELKIYPVAFKGIFENLSIYKAFELKCESCKNYRNGKCSILKDSLNGTVRDEVDTNELTKPLCNAYVERKNTKKRYTT